MAIAISASLLAHQHLSNDCSFHPFKSLLQQETPSQTGMIDPNSGFHIIFYITIHPENRYKLAIKKVWDFLAEKIGDPLLFESCR